jgi:hypothetical protein
VGLAANLRPDFRIGLDGEVAQRSVLRRPGPVRDASQFRCFRSGKQFAGLLQGSLEAPRAKVILPAFHQRRFELDRKDLLENGNVLVEKLFLQIDRVRGNDRLLLFLDRIEDGRREVSDRFAHPRPGLDDQMAFLLERARDGHRHLLLLGPILEVFRAGEQSLLGKERAHFFDEIALERVS